MIQFLIAALVAPALVAGHRTSTETLAEAVQASWARDHARSHAFFAQPPKAIQIDYRVTLRPTLSDAELAKMEAEVSRNPQHWQRGPLARERSLRRDGPKTFDARLAFSRADRFRHAGLPSGPSGSGVVQARRGSEAWVMSGPSVNLLSPSDQSFPAAVSDSASFGEVHALLFGPFASAVPGIRAVRVEQETPSVILALDFGEGYSARATGRWDAATQTFFPERTQYFKDGRSTTAETYGPARFEPLVDGLVYASITREPPTPLGDLELVSIAPIAPSAVEALVADPVDRADDPWLGRLRLSPINNYRDPAPPARP